MLFVHQIYPFRRPNSNKTSLCNKFITYKLKGNTKTNDDDIFMAFFLIKNTNLYLEMTVKNYIQ